jgi:required for meiotic nuclear division protein 1
MKHKVFAFQIAEQIDLRNFRKAFTGNLFYSDSSELFYIADEDKFFFVLVYGVVVFSGYDDVKMSEIIEFLKPFCKNILTEKMEEEFQINIIKDNDVFGYNEISISRFDPMIMRIILINVAQSVSLDYFSRQAEILLDITQQQTLQLEKTGKLKISGKKLSKFIARSLNVKNRIADNLYIFNSPSETWEDEYLDKIDRGLKKTFDINSRYRAITEDVNIIKENLDLFKDLMQHQQNKMLEWIIIILILVEVINLLFEKLF